MELFRILIKVVDIYLYTFANIPRSVYHRVNFSACKRRNLSLTERLFQKHHINKSIYYIAFWVWLLSLGKMHLRFTHVVVCGCRSLHFLSEHTPSFGCAALFIWELLEEHELVPALFSDYGRRCYKYSHSGFCVNISFHFSWVNISVGFLGYTLSVFLAF